MFDIPGTFCYYVSMSEWVHRLEWYEIEKMSGECGECGLVRIVGKRRSNGKMGYRCAISVAQHRGTNYRYAMKDGTFIYISKVERDKLMAEFGQSCAICGSTEKLQLEHCHETGKWRGALCKPCNTAIGLLNEDKRLFDNAVRYLS